MFVIAFVAVMTMIALGAYLARDSREAVRAAMLILASSSLQGVAATAVDTSRQAASAMTFTLLAGLTCTACHASEGREHGAPRTVNCAIVRHLPQRRGIYAAIRSAGARRPVSTQTSVHGKRMAAEGDAAWPPVLTVTARTASSA